MNPVRRFFAGISSILSVLWPDPDYWQYWPVDDEPAPAPGILDKQPIPTVSPDEIRAAADAIEALAYLHDYSDVAHVAWSPAELREAAEEMQQ